MSTLMSNTAIYSVESNRPATTKQLYAVANHFGRLYDSKNSWKFGKVFGAILLKHQTEHRDTPITHGDIQNYFKADKVPSKFVNQISLKAPEKKVKEKVEKTITPPKTDNKKIEALEKKLATLDAKLEIIMAYIQADPEA